MCVYYSVQAFTPGYSHTGKVSNSLSFMLNPPRSFRLRLRGFEGTDLFDKHLTSFPCLKKLVRSKHICRCPFSAVLIRIASSPRTPPLGRGSTAQRGKILMLSSSHRKPRFQERSASVREVFLFVFPKSCEPKITDKPCRPIYYSASLKSHRR